MPLSRHIFKAPTRFYKTGVVFLAWLNGHQEHFLMAGGQQSTRSLSTSPNSSASPTRPAASPIRNWQRNGCGGCWRWVGWGERAEGFASEGKEEWSPTLHFTTPGGRGRPGGPG